MEVKTVTLQIPETVYLKYKQRAEQTNRTIEAEVLEAVSIAAPDNALPAELAEELNAMTLYTDEALKKIVRTKIPAKDRQQMRQLNHKQQKEGRVSLSDAELETLDELGNAYDRHVLIRSQALFWLQQRGDIEIIQNN
jgi:hypothetical protein